MLFMLVKSHASIQEFALSFRVAHHKYVLHMRMKLYARDFYISREATHATIWLRDTRVVQNNFTICR